jgi:hypothetical protein
MTVPEVTVWLISGYALALLGLAWVLDVTGARSAIRSARWRTGNFVYHDDQDAWRCHQDQWLWPVAFDPDKRVIRYTGQHAICGRCPVKQTCSPTPGPRELTRPVDPWPHSETGRFHRGLAVCVAAAGLMLTVGSLIAHHDVGDVIVLGTTTVVLMSGLCRLGVDLLRTPANAPAHLSLEEALEEPPESGPAQGGRLGPSLPSQVDDVVDRYATTWGLGGRRRTGGDR